MPDCRYVALVTSVVTFLLVVDIKLHVHKDKRWSPKINSSHSGLVSMSCH